MMRMTLVFLSAAAMLVGCSSRTDDLKQDSGNASGEGGIRMANPFHDDLMKLSPGNQRLAMLRALRATGYKREHCRNVDNAGYQEEFRNMRMWVAECVAERRSYAVFIAPNTEIQVRNCADAGTLSLPRCQGLPPPQEDPTMPKVQEGASDEAYRTRPAIPQK
jgi:hypothetical protein